MILSLSTPLSPKPTLFSSKAGLAKQTLCSAVICRSIPILRTLTSYWARRCFGRSRKIPGPGANPMRLYGKRRLSPHSPSSLQAPSTVLQRRRPKNCCARLCSSGRFFRRGQVAYQDAGMDAQRFRRLVLSRAHQVQRKSLRGGCSRLPAIPQARPQRREGPKTISVSPTLVWAEPTMPSPPIAPRSIGKAMPPQRFPAPSSTLPTCSSTRIVPMNPFRIFTKPFKSPRRIPRPTNSSARPMPA